MTFEIVLDVQVLLPIVQILPRFYIWIDKLLGLLGLSCELGAHIANFDA